jgi:transcriptional regulator with XRE-family HTH domain
MPRPPKIRHSLAALRTRLDLEQKEFAYEIGISASYLRAIENEQRPLRGKLGARVADRYGVSLSWLLAGKPGSDGAPIPTSDSCPAKFREVSVESYAAHRRRRERQKASQIAPESLPKLDDVIEMARQDFNAILRANRTDGETTMLCFYKIADGLNSLAKELTDEFGIDSDYQMAMLESLTARLYGVPDESTPTFESIQIEDEFTREEIEAADLAAEE